MWGGGECKEGRCAVGWVAQVCSGVCAHFLFLTWEVLLWAGDEKQADSNQLFLNKKTQSPSSRTYCSLSTHILTLESTGQLSPAP